MAEAVSDAVMMERMQMLRTRVKNGEEELRPLLELTINTIQGKNTVPDGPWVSRLLKL